VASRSSGRSGEQPDRGGPCLDRSSARFVRLRDNLGTGPGCPGSTPGSASAGHRSSGASSVPLLCPYGHASGGDGGEEWLRWGVHGAKEISWVTALAAAGIRWQCPASGFGTKGCQVRTGSRAGDRARAALGIGNSIAAVILSRTRLTPTASIAGQYQKNRLYGRDSPVEVALSSLEGAVAPIIRRAIEKQEVGRS
jgi:hypothetical protein